MTGKFYSPIEQTEYKIRKKVQTYQLDTQASHSWQFYLTAEEAWNAIYADCATARDTIMFEQYILRNDRIGLRFLELLTQKAKEGIKVYLLCDSFGSLELSIFNLAKDLIAAGGKVYFYRPIKIHHLFHPFMWFPRNHKKIVLIDSTIAYLGSVCFDERMRYWRDTQMKIEGPVVEDIAVDFNSLWSKSVQHYIPNASNVSGEFEYCTVVPGVSNSASIYDELREAITNAKRYVYLATAYFIPDEGFIFSLQEAARRKVDVLLVIPSYSGMVSIDMVAFSYIPALTTAGIQVFLYEGNVLHTKYTVIDDEWATVGSTNLDYLSFFRNLEANIIIKDKKAIWELKSHFLADVSKSRKVTRIEWEGRPFWQKILGYMGRMIKRLL